MSLTQKQIELIFTIDQKIKTLLADGNNESSIMVALFDRMLEVGDLIK